MVLEVAGGKVVKITGHKSHPANLMQRESRQRRKSMPHLAEAILLSSELRQGAVQDVACVPGS